MTNREGSTKRLRWGLLLVAVLLISAAAIPLTGLAVRRQWDAEEVIAAFEAAGLEAVDSRPMTLAEIGAAPNLAEEAWLFPIWSLKGCFCAQEPRGYVMTFDNAESLHAVKAYYEELGAQSVVYEKWILTRGNVLVVLPGAIKAEDAQDYRTVLDRL